MQISYILYLKNVAAQFLMYRRVYGNYFSVIRYNMMNAFPFKATLKDGTQVTLVNRYNAWYYTRVHGVKGIGYDTSSNITTISTLPYLACLHLKIQYEIFLIL
jgi:hypothetical protein